MHLSREEAFALIAEAIRRSVGVTVDDVQLAIGLAMCDQIRQVRRWRTARSLKSLNQLVRTRRDRSLATAFPAIYTSSFVGTNVCVMVESEAYAREDADLYRAIIDVLSMPTVVHHGLPPQAEAGEHRASLLVSTPEVLAQTGSGHQAVLIARLSPQQSKRLGRLGGAATLPDL